MFAKLRTLDLGRDQFDFICDAFHGKRLVRGTMHLVGIAVIQIRTHKYTNTMMRFMGNFWLGPEGIFVKGRGISQELLESQNYSTAARIDPKLSNDFPLR